LTELRSKSLHSSFRCVAIGDDLPCTSVVKEGSFPFKDTERSLFYSKQTTHRHRYWKYSLFRHWLYPPLLSSLSGLHT
jgi:hypothetical protein